MLDGSGDKQGARSQKPEVRSQKSEGRGRRTEDGRPVAVECGLITTKTMKTINERAASVAAAVWDGWIAPKAGLGVLVGRGLMGWVWGLGILTAVSMSMGCLVQAAELTIETMPPVVVKTVPAAGDLEVAPGVIEVRVTFSKPMQDRSWSWSSAWPGSEPAIVGQPRYDADGRTCVLKVKIEPNRAYGWWLNSEKFKNFKDSGGRPAVPYLLTFQTKDR